MAVTVLASDLETSSDRAHVEGDDLWLPVDELPGTTGWELKPEGVCREEVCVPIQGDATSLVTKRDGGSWLNFAGFARYFGLPLAHDDARAAWYFGESADAQRTRMESLQAPDFELADLEGRKHRLSDLRGKKVLLALWASW